MTNVVFKHGLQNSLPLELVESLNHAYFLYVLATEPHKVTPPGKSLLSMLLHSQLSSTTKGEDDAQPLLERVKEVAHKAFWDEVRSETWTSRCILDVLIYILPGRRFNREPRTCYPAVAPETLVPGPGRSFGASTPLQSLGYSDTALSSCTYDCTAAFDTLGARRSACFSEGTLRTCSRCRNRPSPLQPRRSQYKF